MLTIFLFMSIDYLILYFKPIYLKKYCFERDSLLLEVDQLIIFFPMMYNMTLFEEDIFWGPGGQRLPKLVVLTINNPSNKVKWFYPTTRNFLRELMPGPVNIKLMWSSV